MVNAEDLCIFINSWRQSLCILHNFYTGKIVNWYFSKSIDQKRSTTLFTKIKTIFSDRNTPLLKNSTYDTQ